MLAQIFRWQPWSEANCVKIGSMVLRAVSNGSNTEEFGMLFCTESSPERVRTKLWKPTNYPALTDAGEAFLDQFDEYKANEAQIKLPML